MEEKRSTSFFKKWWISSRPFSFPASTMPVIFGTVLAYVYGGYEFKPVLFIHITDTYQDMVSFCNGVDHVQSDAAALFASFVCRCA